MSNKLQSVNLKFPVMVAKYSNTKEYTFLLFPNLSVLQWYIINCYWAYCYNELYSFNYALSVTSEPTYQSLILDVYTQWLFTHSLIYF